MRHLPALLLAALAPSASQAATITVNSTTIGNTLYIPQFDPALGTLQSLSGTLTGFATYRFTFNGRNVPNVSYTASSFFGIYTGPTFFDGVLTGAGVVDIDGAGQAVISTSGTATDVRSSATVLNFFTGTSSVTGSPSADFPTPVSFTPNGGGITNVESLIREGSLEVTYTFAPIGGEVPEPATWALMLAGFAGTGLTLRRRRTTASAG